MLPVLPVDVSRDGWPALPEEDATGKTGQEHILKLVGKLNFYIMHREVHNWKVLVGKEKGKKENLPNSLCFE